VNSVTQAKAIIEADSFDEFVARITNDKVKHLVLEKIDEPQFNAGKRQFVAKRLHAGKAESHQGAARRPRSRLGRNREFARDRST
jgi:hypothetical protein